MLNSNLTPLWFIPSNFITTIFLTVLFSIFFASYLSAQTEVSGEVEGEWTLEESPYLVIGEIEVPNRETLTIEAGVEVLFVEDVPFIVFGQLVARGTEEDSIIFVPNDNNNWGGLRFYSSDDDTRLSYCVIESGRRGWGDGEPNNMDRSGGNIFLLNSDILIEHSRISFGSAGGFGGGIGVWRSQPVIRDCIISENESGSQGGGVNLSDEASATFQQCQFIENIAH